MGPDLALVLESSDYPPPILFSQLLHLGDPALLAQFHYFPVGCTLDAEGLSVEYLEMVYLPLWHPYLVLDLVLFLFLDLD